MKVSLQTLRPLLLRLPKPAQDVAWLTLALWRQTIRDRIGVRASQLAFWTSVAMVPLFLLAFALTRPIGALEGLEPAVRAFLLDTIVAGSANEVSALISQLTSPAHAQALGIAGLGGIFLSGLQLYLRAEQAYNDIFAVRIRRSLLLRFALFYTLLTLGPIALAAGLVAAMRIEGPALGWAAPIGLLLPMFVLAIKALPCATVRWTSAAWGGLVSAFGFEVAKRGFHAYAVLFGTRDTMTILYGSLGFLPVFLLWLYTAWTVILLGVELAYVLEHRATLMGAERRQAVDPHALQRKPDGPFALGLLTAMAARFEAGRGSAVPEELALELGADPHHVQSALDVLEDAGLVMETRSGSYAPARPLADLGAAEVLRSWRVFGAPLLEGDSVAARVVEASAKAVESAVETPVGNLVDLPLSTREH